MQFSTENACISAMIIVSAQDYVILDYNFTDNYYNYKKY
jgi:hypothetical protein